MKENYISIKKATEISSVSDKTIRTMIKKYGIPSVRANNNATMIDREAFVKTATAIGYIIYGDIRPTMTAINDAYVEIEGEVDAVKIVEKQRRIITLLEMKIEEQLKTIKSLRK